LGLPVGSSDALHHIIVKTCDLPQAILT
jgi:hypothetical protein